MKNIAVITIFAISSLFAEEWAVIDGVAPSKEKELVTIPIFDTDEPNGTPYRVALRDVASKKILDSFLWEGDMGDEHAHKRNKALWSPTGQFVAVYMRSGRLSAATAYFLVDRKKLVRIDPPDAWQNVLGRFNTTEAGPNGGISPIEWTDKNHLKIAIIGAADTDKGRIPFNYNATLRFEGGDGVVPWIRLENANPTNEEANKSEQATPRKPPD